MVFVCSLTKILKSELRLTFLLDKASGRVNDLPVRIAGPDGRIGFQGLLDVRLFVDKAGPERRTRTARSSRTQVLNVKKVFVQVKFLDKGVYKEFTQMSTLKAEI